MCYLFFDLEYATSKGSSIKICEFGYVLVDEKFNVLERSNYIINPNIPKSEWDMRVVKRILTKEMKEYESSLIFPYYYDKIKKLINSANYIIGHTINGDAKALNDECKRYNLESLDYSFYDVKLIYKDYSNNKKDTSVVNILKELNIEGEKNFHDAETDAYNTMLELKSMLETLKITFEEIIELCPDSKDETLNYKVKSRNNKSRKRVNVKKKKKDISNATIGEILKTKGINIKEFVKSKN